jgi:electron-transferring-flavoprotein dehydrogenase
LTQGGSSYTIPNFLLPSQLHNEGNYILSPCQLCRRLASEAEQLGVEIYPGLAASEVLLVDSDKDIGIDGATAGAGAVKGIATRDAGIAKDRTPKSTFQRGVELHAKQTLFAEGARGSCSEFLMKHFGLRNRNGNDVQTQTYGLGIKEVWQVS